MKVSTGIYVMKVSTGIKKKNYMDTVWPMYLATSPLYLSGIWLVIRRSEAQILIGD